MRTTDWFILCFCCQTLLFRSGDCGWSGGTQWATAEEEAEDEKRDPELLQAIVESIKQWEARHANRTRQKRAEASVCYSEVGCFRDSGYLEMLPSPPQEVGTRFLLFSSRHSRRADTPLMDVSFTNMSALYDWADKAFNVSAPTKVIVHGFGSSCSHVWVYEMRSALMSVEDCNVLCVDWEGGAKFPNYVRAAANTRLVGRQLSMLLSSLRDKHALDLSKVHIIGFSLGAHAAAFAGAQLGSLSRITGLDPAGPLFEAQEPSERLDSSDASFVDVIHSNGETLILGGLGSWQPMGHVDFYPNGGRMQKGCSNLFVGAFTDILWSGAAIEGRSLCNHRRAYKFFTDSVSPRCPFPAVPCSSYEAFLSGECFPCPFGDSCPSMGYYADQAKAKGTLYLVTRDEEPFCAHQYLVRLESTPSALPVISYGKIELTLVADPFINETFSLTQKDDEELVVGGSLSRIVVPHPALQEFTAVAVLYTAYAGWISSGLGKWSIDKLTLTDSFGRMLSVCNKGLVLESGVAVILPLHPGNCGDPKKEDQQLSSPKNKTNVTEGEDKNRTSSYHPTQVVFVGDEVLEPNASSTKDYKVTNLLGEPWHPVLDIPDESGHNGLETASSEDAARGFRESKPRNTSDKITVKSEPYEYEKVEPVDSERNETESGPPEIKEPVLAATTAKPKASEKIRPPEPDLSPPAVGATESWLHWEQSASTGKRAKQLDLDRAEKNEGNASTSESALRSFTVQLFPQRLVAFLERAEQYARSAFAPFFESEEERSPRRLGLFRFPWTSERSTESSPRAVALRHEETANKYIPLTREKGPSTEEPGTEKPDLRLPETVSDHVEEPVPPEHTEYTLPKVEKA